MFWSKASSQHSNLRDHASAAEVVQCFRSQSHTLRRLALLITEDQAMADECVVEACESTFRGNSPFREWLLEWAKVITVASAVSRQAAAIRACEAIHISERCTHPEHLSLIDGEQRAACLDVLLQRNPREVIGQLDPLCRAVLVLRVATGSSFHDCVLRLTVSRAAVLAANCLAMAWLSDMQSSPMLEEPPHSLQFGDAEICDVM